jgi:hypothetical protein
VLINWLSTSTSPDGAEVGGEKFVFEIDEYSIIDDTATADAMKAITRSLGFGSNRTSSHSLRYGGATLLAAAGVPSYAITHFGGWSENSKMLRRYVQLGGQMTDDVSRAMSDSFGKSVVEARIRQNTLSGR